MKLTKKRMILEAARTVFLVPLVYIIYITSNASTEAYYMMGFLALMIALLTAWLEVNKAP